MAATRTILKQYLNINNDVEDDFLDTVLAAAITRIKALTCTSEEDDLEDSLDNAVLVLAAHYYQNRDGTEREPYLHRYLGSHYAWPL